MKMRSSPVRGGTTSSLRWQRETRPGCLEMSRCISKPANWLAICDEEQTVSGQFGVMDGSGDLPRAFSMAITFLSFRSP